MSTRDLIARQKQIIDSAAANGETITATESWYLAALQHCGGDAHAAARLLASGMPTRKRIARGPLVDVPEDDDHDPQIPLWEAAAPPSVIVNLDETGEPILIPGSVATPEQFDMHCDLGIREGMRILRHHKGKKKAIGEVEWEDRDAPIRPQLDQMRKQLGGGQ